MGDEGKASLAWNEFFSFLFFYFYFILFVVRTKDWKDFRSISFDFGEKF